ncbi:MAG: type I-U CRISPR-associated protein Cas7 [Planctomycetota bacterium]|nr:MAG: type I-U CRISPR-associated protein Cas7 [Planctomycetota bacterium]
MSTATSALADQKRLLLSVPLRPVQGHRFQPTGFPDLGAATYQAPIDENRSVSCLLVESPQSMANRLEATIWDSGNNELIDCCKGLSYVRVNDPDGNYLTSSIEEAHRLNSVYIEAADERAFHKKLKEETGFDEKRPVNRGQFLKTVFRYDCNSLLHGVFLESVGGRLRVARAVSSFIEADNVEVVASGGVKNDKVRPGTESGSEKTAAEGYGNVPFPREEYAAERITAYFNLDLAQIRSYGLPDPAEQLLIALGLYKIRALLDGDLRLRTACDFVVATEGAIEADRPSGFVLPDLEELASEVRAAVDACRDAELFAGENGVTTVTYSFK